MDRLIEQHLEEYLSGSLEPRQLAEFERRLELADEYTRKTVAEFSGHSHLLSETLRAPADADPAPGFYARVMQRVEEQKASAWWSVFLEPQFSKRLAFASLTLLVLLGITMYTTGQESTVAVSTPAEVMALPSSEPAFDFDASQANPEQGRDIILVDLATYHE